MASCLSWAGTILTLAARQGPASTGCVLELHKADGGIRLKLTTFWMGFTNRLSSVLQLELLVLPILILNS